MLRSFYVKNLYGVSICDFLPYEGFKWADTHTDVFCIPADSPIAYFLEVDLEYFQNVLDKHQDLPFYPEHHVPPDCKLTKLITTLYDKESWIIHYRNLKNALGNGLIVKNIYLVLQFKQGACFKPYIDHNTQLKAYAKNDFEKNSFKLMNNVVLENIVEYSRKHRMVKIVNKWGGRYAADDLIASNSFHNRTIFENNLIKLEITETDWSKNCLYDYFINIYSVNLEIDIK